MDDDCAGADDWLLDIALAAISRARNISLATITARMKRPPFWTEVWPGEHYKFLAALVDVVRPVGIVEIGTHLGLSALALLEYGEPGSKLVTYDIVPWHAFGESCLRMEDFAHGRIVQSIADLADMSTLDLHRDVLRDAELIFVDGPKDGHFESDFLSNLRSVKFKKAPLLVFDDIRLWNMLSIWRSIQVPKLDVTSFGHWSGTGLVHWTRSEDAP